MVESVKVKVLRPLTVRSRTMVQVRSFWDRVKVRLLTLPAMAVCVVPTFRTTDPSSTYPSLSSSLPLAGSFGSATSWNWMGVPCVTAPLA